jgi:uncharacterized protein YbjT (DUF2867 family)
MRMVYFVDMLTGRALSLWPDRLSLSYDEEEIGPVDILLDGRVVCTSDVHPIKAVALLESALHSKLTEEEVGPVADPEPELVSGIACRFCGTAIPGDVMNQYDGLCSVCYETGRE